MWMPLDVGLYTLSCRSSCKTTLRCRLKWVLKCACCQCIVVHHLCRCRADWAHRARWRWSDRFVRRCIVWLRSIGPLHAHAYPWAVVTLLFHERVGRNYSCLRMGFFSSWFPPTSSGPVASSGAVVYSSADAKVIGIVCIIDFCHEIFSSIFNLLRFSFLNLPWADE